MWLLHPLTYYLMLVASLLCHFWPPLLGIAFPNWHNIEPGGVELWESLSKSNIFLGLLYENIASLNNFWDWFDFFKYSLYWLNFHDDAFVSFLRKELTRQKRKVLDEKGLDTLSEICTKVFDKQAPSKTTTKTNKHTKKTKQNNMKKYNLQGNHYKN